MAYTNQQFHSVAKRVNDSYQLVSFHRLIGGVSAEVFALQVEGEDGQRSRLVFRLHGDRDFLRNPNIAKEEFILLDVLSRAGLPVSKPYFLDESCTIFSRPYLVMQFIDGTTEVALDNLENSVEQLAEGLARIHRLDLSGLDLAFLPDCKEHFARFIENRPLELDNSLSEEKIRAVLEPSWPLSGGNQSVVLHGDFWPGNIMWKDGSLAGILDWEDAMVGDPLADLAIARLEVCWAYGLGLMEKFTQHYASIVKLDFTNLPYWDLAAALRAVSSLPFWGLEEVKESLIRQRHQEFVEHVLGRLPA